MSNSIKQFESMVSAKQNLLKNYSAISGTIRTELATTWLLNFVGHILADYPWTFSLYKCNIPIPIPPSLP